MKQIFGWADFDTREIDHAQVDNIVKKYFTNPEVRVTSKTIGGSGVFKANAVENRDIYQNEKLSVVLEGHAYFIDKSLQAQAQNAGLAKFIADLFSQSGPSFLKQLYGSFALAIINTADKETFLAVDRLGICALSYSMADERFIFSSDARLIRAHRDFNVSVDPQAIFNYLYFHVVPLPQHIFKNIVRLLPGEYVVHRKGTVRHEKYWQVNYQHKHKHSKNHLRTELLTALQECVNTAIVDSEKPGAFLSGGIDSSTVAGMLGKVTGAPAKTYSIGFDAEGFDEMEFARISARHFNTEHHEYYVTPQDVVDAIPQIAKMYDQPFGNASAVPALYCARMAKADGVDRLLAGDGGDELFGGNARYAKQNVFSFYDKIPSAIRHNLIEPVFTGLLANINKVPFSKIRSYIQQANAPMPERMESYNLLNRIGIEKIFHGDFLEKVNFQHPIELQKAIYDSAQADNLIDNMLALDLKFTLADNDLPKVTKMCELANIDVTFPWLNDQLVEYSARLPAHYKVKGTKLRYFIKQCLQDFLPKETITKEKHGFGLPFGVWLLSFKPLHDLAFDKLNSLRSRRIMNNPFLDELMNKHLSEHPTYYGTFVWILMMLEEWYEQHDIS